MRSRYGRPPLRRKTTKIRPSIRVKERVAKKGGRCSACRHRFEIGDFVTVVNIRRRTYHTATCVPANVGQMPTAAGPAIANTPTAVVQALSALWAPAEAKLVAMQALENALVVVAKSRAVRDANGELQFLPEHESAFDRFYKLKAMALRPGSENEGDMALCEAVVKLVKTLFK